MRSRAPRSAKRRKKSASRAGSPRAGQGRGWRTFFFLWIGVIVLFAAVWAGYTIWTGRKARAPQPPAAGSLPPTQVEVTLYFSDEQAEYLVPESRRIPRAEDPSAMTQSVVGELIRGPRSGLQPTIPHGTQVRKGTACHNGACTVDLSEEVVSNHPGGSSGELMTLYSIVESLRANIPGVRSVQILVDGKSRETLAGHISIAAPLRPDPRYVRN